MSAQEQPIVIEHAGPLLAEYRVLVCDVWGVVHNGSTAYEPAGEALARFRTSGGTVVLLSNAPLPRDRVAHVLDEKRVRRDAWDIIVSSGDITRAHVAEVGYRRLYHIGPDRDLAVFEGMAAQRTGLALADGIVCTGLIDDINETAESYRATLEEALSRELPLVCANPDLIVDVGGRLLPCAGVVARLYEELGGPVYWAGKPHAPAYQMALAAANALRGGEVALEHVLAIGDALRTDIAGAVAFGLDALFIAQGIHREDVMTAGRVDGAQLAELFRCAPFRPVAAMDELRW